MTQQAEHGSRSVIEWGGVAGALKGAPEWQLPGSLHHFHSWSWGACAKAAEAYATVATAYMRR